MQGYFLDLLCRGGYSHYELISGVEIFTSLQPFRPFSRNEPCYWLACFQQHVIMDIQKGLFARVIRLPKSFFDSKETGYLMCRIGQDAFRLQILLSGTIIQAVPELLKLPAALMILIWLNWQLTVMLLFFLPLLFVIALRIGLKSQSLSVRLMERSASVFRELHQSLSSITLIKSFASEPREYEKFQARLHNSFRSGLEQVVLSTSASLVISLTCSVMVSLCTWWGVREVLAAKMTVGDYVAFSGYLLYLFAPLQSAASLHVNIQSSLAALGRVFELLDAVPEDIDDTGKISVERIRGSIEFQDVSFSYDGKTPVLKNISFRVESGQSVAIVGPSGSGKSTLISLILQLYKPSSGRILIDGRDVRDLQLRTLRERIGIVSQDVLLLDDTIYNNICYGCPQATDEQVRAAARMACAEDFILALPDGYMTKVGERGVKLSAGERQRISIARVLIKNPDLLILDEPTAALDPITERAIKQTLQLFVSAKTVFIIAHRLSTVISASKILVLNGGRIIQEGTHSELIRQGGLYRRMCEEQFLADLSKESNSGSALTKSPAISYKMDWI